MVHDLVDHQGVKIRFGVERTEGWAAKQREVRPAGALGMQTDRNVRRRGAEVDVLAVSAGNAAGVG